MKLKPIVHMLLIFTTLASANGFKFKDLDNIVNKNSNFYNSKKHPIPQNHRFSGKYSYYAESESILFINNKHRYKSRTLDRFESKKGIPEFHTALFFDSNPRYSSSAVAQRGSKKLFAMEE